MTTQEIASRLHELCQQGQFEVAQTELYHQNATSTDNTPQGVRQTLSGVEAITAKTKKFQEMVEEMHGAYSSEPKVFGNYIFMEMGLDVTLKGMGRMNMVEMCKYEVNDGKIVSEEFFY